MIYSPEPVVWSYEGSVEPNEVGPLCKLQAYCTDESANHSHELVSKSQSCLETGMINTITYNYRLL